MAQLMIIERKDNYAATATEICEFWSAIIATLEEGGRYVKSNINKHRDISQIIHHCCRMGHYTFDVLKCGEEACELCRPVSLPREVFDLIKHLPFPEPGEDGHYKAFSDVFGSDTCTSEDFRPSQKKVTKTKVKTLPFYASVQHIKNSQLMVQCNMWRLVFSKYKLKAAQHQKLQRVICD